MYRANVQELASTIKRDSHWVRTRDKIYHLQEAYIADQFYFPRDIPKIIIFYAAEVYCGFDHTYVSCIWQPPIGYTCIDPTRNLFTIPIEEMVINTAKNEHNARMH